MEWYWWLAVGVVTVAIAAIIGLRIFRATRRGRRFMALALRAKLQFGRVLLEDREVPLVAKAVLALLVAYLALPFDLIPDFIPVAGQLDDALVIVVAMGLLLLAVPRERFDAALTAAEAWQREHDIAGARRIDPDAPFGDSPPPGQLRGGANRRGRGQE